MRVRVEIVAPSSGFAESFVEFRSFALLAIVVLGFDLACESIHSRRAGW